MDWVVGSTIAGGWIGGLVTLGIYIHQNRKSDRQYYDDMMDRRFNVLSKKTDKDHNDVKIQIDDLAETVREHYVPRREADQVYNGLRDTINALREDFRGFSNRLDGFIRGYHRGPHSDG